ncbi:MAG: cytochrome c maturation protein CcmE [Bdellovibrionales bacterium]|nr:cytochrome c maturation protein CcmE [Bdellovibrionales bacterium]
MNKLFVTLVAAFILFGALLTYQASKQGTSEVFTPSELVAKEHDLTRIRVAGRVSSRPISYQVEPEIRLEFTIQTPGKEEGFTPVVYSKLKPDMFAPGRDVIIDGDFKGGILYAHQMLTQCPSKYQPPKPGAAPGEGALDTPSTPL